jgi:aminoglycoside 3-N-acetyltransferase
MESEYVPYLDIFNRLDVRGGDFLLVHSDIRQLAWEGRLHQDPFDANLFISSMLRKLGEEGTLMFPTFNWEFCNGEPFDIRTTPSRMGSLSTVALKRSDFVRTMHPIYSFAVSGRYRDNLRNLQNESGFGPGSAFPFMQHHGGKALIIGLDYQTSFTFVHYVEECEKVNYRYLKKFEGLYTDEKGVQTRRTYSMNVRRLDLGFEMDINPLGVLLEDRGVSTEVFMNKVSFKMIDLGRAFTIIQDEIRENKALRFHKQNDNMSSHDA